MENYNYYDAMYNDIKNAIDEYADNYDDEIRYDRDEFEQNLNDDLWIDDAVIGNASGSYTFNRYTAMEYVTDNMDLLDDACEEFCISDDVRGRHFADDDFEYFDVTIRCYLLSEVLSDVLDDLESDGYFEQSDEQNA